MREIFEPEERERNEALVDRLGPRGFDAVNYYSTRKQFDLNTRLRNPKRVNTRRAEDRKTVKNINKALDVMPEYDGPVYRGVGFDTPDRLTAFLDKYRTGETASDKAYVSGSKSEQVAEDYARQNVQGGMLGHWEFQVIIEIESKSGARDISPVMANMRSVQEVVFKPNQKFKVLEAPTSDDIDTGETKPWRIKLKAVE